MEQPYSVWADWLSKFHNTSEPIQALWIVAIAAILLGGIHLVMRGLSEALLARRRERGVLVYGVYQDRKGRWMVYWHGRQPREVDWTNPPPELVGRGQVIQGPFRRPEE